MRGLGGIGSSLEFSLLDEITPAFVAVGRTLAFFELLLCHFGVLLAFDDFDYARGLIGSDVMADDGIDCDGFFACQRGSVWGWFNSIPGNFCA
jgi:hypothetical protein